MQPDCVLIEAPADAEQSTEYVGRKDLKPPVALLIYADKNPQRAAHVPFAVFSPEWQTMKYAAKRELPVRFMDLPMDITFALTDAERNVTQMSLPAQGEPTPEDLNFRRDPMKYMAQAAGYTDSERWWEVMFEQPDNETEVFTAILEMTTALRKEIKHEQPRTLLREAYMRKIMRKAVKDGYERIAVVCGAYHAPVLHTWQDFKQSADNALLRGLKKVKTRTAWVPWSYSRLTFRSGYTAGVNSPAWYEMLFKARSEAAVRWMVQAARLFRSKDLAASSAHALEAVRLAETLAVIRNLSLPGIDELRAAAVSVLCDGEEHRMQLIDEKLIVGDVIGKVSPDMPVIPLQKNLEQQIKSARLTAYRNTTEELWLKATSTKKRGGLDLRIDADLLKSLLLHRLNVLNIPWGKLQKETGRETSTFHEYWKMKWKPDFSLRIIEAGMWGNTVAEAAAAKLSDTARRAERLAELTRLTEQALQADLFVTVAELVRLLEQKSALTTDVLHLADTLPVLVNIIRYGDVRGTHTEAVRTVTEQIVPRICIGLPAACTHTDDTAAEAILQNIIAVNHALGLLNSEEFNRNWRDCLHRLAETSQAHFMLRGLSVRMLFDKNYLTVEETAVRTDFALSTGQESLAAAQWAEGFLYGSGLVILHHPELHRILDEWVDGLSKDTFTEILPVLRRTFSKFSAHEREQMLLLVKNGGLVPSAGQDRPDKRRAARVVPTVRLLLGYESIES